MNIPDTTEYTRAPSLADEITFAELAQPQQAAICRLFGKGGVIGNNAEMLKDAYRAGAEDAIEAATVDGGYSDHDWKRYLNSLGGTRGA